MCRVRSIFSSCRSRRSRFPTWHFQISPARQPDSAKAHGVGATARFVSAQLVHPILLVALGGRGPLAADMERQKQLCANTASRWRGSTTSGDPGRTLLPSGKRYPTQCRTLRTIFSGPVFLLETFAIMELRFSHAIQSIEEPQADQEYQYSSLHLGTQGASVPLPGQLPYGLRGRAGKCVLYQFTTKHRRVLDNSTLTIRGR